MVGYGGLVVVGSVQMKAVSLSLLLLKEEMFPDCSAKIVIMFTHQTDN